MATEQVIEDHRQKIKNLTYELSRAIKAWHQHGLGDVILTEHRDPANALRLDAVTVQFFDETAQRQD